MITRFEIRLAKFLGYCLDKCERSPFSLNNYDYNGIIFGEYVDNFFPLVHSELEYHDLVESLRGLVDL